MKKVKIIVAAHADKDAFHILPEGKFSIDYKPTVSNFQLLKKYKRHDVLVVRSTRKIDEKYLSECGHKLIATLSKGTDHIDSGFAKSKNIRIISSESGNSISAAEHTLTLMLASYKNILFSDWLVRMNKFDEYNYERCELYGKKIGIIGYGRVGGYFGNLCKSLGMKVYANDIDRKVILRNNDVKFVSPEFILKKCNVISIHIPLNVLNKNFINKERLESINENALLINTSRGEVLDEDALIELLQKRKIKFAALDVFKDEPEINSKLRNLKNVLLTNHIAGKTIESKKRVSRHIFLGIKKFYNSRKF